MANENPPKNSELTTQDSQSRILTRDCAQCVNATPAWNGPEGLLLCVCHPDHAGQLTLVAASPGQVEDAGPCCRNFRARPEATTTGNVVAGNNVRQIALGSGLFALVDAADFEWLNRYRWRAAGGEASYACAWIGGLAK